MSDWLNKTHVGDCRALLAAMAADDVKVQTCVTSPPYYGLRDYGHALQIGLERTPAGYVEQLVAVFRAVRDVLADDGTLWINLGDSYANDAKWGGSTGGKHVTALHGNTGIGREKKSTGVGPKNLIGIPWRVAFALQADGWYLRSDVIWAKPNPMPESVTDRPTKSHEYLFLLAKSERYYYDAEAIKEPATDTGRINGVDGRDEHAAARPPGSNPRTLARIDYSALGRNKRTVWTVPTKPQPEAHFACFPPDLIEPCILAGAPSGGIVLDPFMGSGTAARVALSLGRQFIGCELNPAYAGIQNKIGLQAGMAI
jgi:DNA modification methylase